ncbi:tandem-95 repeat protein [uncultured Shewanella sp.]|uniref:tandem-95 repeat protein n=1 Tax=uncultured Shewanella sp. TaxID=173975 RepID=UPI002629735B|nr:tandem-95 repeat protein [uncultured Shewanella sp.]
MATDPKDPKHPLNNAEEQIVTDDAAASSTNAKNQEESAAIAAATASGEAHFADDKRNALNEGETGAGHGDDVASSAKRTLQPDEEVKAKSADIAQSKVIDSQKLAEEREEPISSSNIGDQSVGGKPLDSALDANDANNIQTEGNNLASSIGDSAVSGAGGQDEASEQSRVEDEFDTKTTTETFEVDVLDTVDDDANVNLEDEFDSQTTSQVIEVQVDAVNDGPTADDLDLVMQEDGRLLITAEALLANSHDIDGDDLSIFAVQYDDKDGVLKPIPNTDDYYFLPNKDFSGDVRLTYQVSDGTETVSARINIHVEEINDTPIILGSLAYSMDEDGHLHLSQAQLLHNAEDIEGDHLVAENLSIGDFGTVIANKNGSFTIVPDQHYSGELELLFDVSDGASRVQQVMKIDVEAVADAPELEITDPDGNDLSNSKVTIDPDDTFELNIGAVLVDQDLSETLTVTLDGVPKGSVINVDGDALLQNQANGLQSFEETQVTITFEGESAGYQNSVGVYKVDESGHLKDVEIIFDNASAQGSGGALIAGESSFTFNIGEGEHFNLFTVPNGARTVSKLSQNDGQFVFRNDDGTPATMDSISPQLVFISDEKEVVVTGAAGDAVYHGGDSRNLNADNIVHTRTELNEDNEIIYGFEDLFGGGDRDYDDFTFSIDMGAVNNQLYAGEIMVDESESIQLPTSAISETIQISLPDDFSREFDIRVEATARELSNDDTSTVFQTVHVDAREHAPETESKGATIDEDGDYIFTLDDFPFVDQNEADTLDSISIVALPLNGKMQLGDEPISDNQVISRADIEAGLLSYHSELNFNGEVNLTYTVSDGELHSQPQAFTINVDPVNDPVIAKADKVETLEDTKTVFKAKDLLRNDEDVDGDKLHITDVHASRDTHGKVSLNKEGDVVFIPEKDFFGEAVFEYTVSDLAGSTDTAKVTINVTPDNDPVIAKADKVEAQEDSKTVFKAKDLLRNDEDADGDKLYIAEVIPGRDTHGKVSLNEEGDVVFIPEENFFGEAVFEYTVSDSMGSTDTAKVTINVTPDNDPVIAHQDWVDSQEDTKTVFKAKDLLRNDEDIDGDKLHITDVHAGRDTHGEVSLNKEGDVVFVPEKNFFGEAVFEYTVSDGAGSTDTAKVTINVTPDNDPVIAKADKVEAQEDSKTVFTAKELLANDFDVDKDQLYITHVDTGPQTHGEAYLNEAGNVVFIPEKNFFGEAVFEYTVSDLAGSTDTAKVTINVTPENDPVIAKDDWEETQEDTKTVFKAKDLLRNDEDADGDKLHITDVQAGRDTHGEVSLNKEGDVVFVPEKNFFGEAVFEYTVSDGAGSTDTAKVMINVTPDNDPVIAKADKVGAQEDTKTVFTAKELLANDFDVDKDQLYITHVETGPQTHGEAYLNGAGNVVFIPEKDYFGEAVFEYTVSDLAGSTDTAKVTINVTPENDPVIAKADKVEAKEDSKTVFKAKDLLRNDEDVDGDKLHITDVQAGRDTHGEVSLNKEGDVVFVPEKNFFGEAVFEYTVSDGAGSSDTAKVTINVTPENDPVIAKADKVETQEDSKTVFKAKDLLRNDEDVDDDKLHITDVYAGRDTHGKVSLNEEGDVVFIPEKNFFGEAVFEYTVSDGAGGSDKANVTVLVTPENDPVIARDDYTMNAEPLIRLDVEPEHGVLQYQDHEGHWQDMEVGVEYSADLQVQFKPDIEDILSHTVDTQIGTFGGKATMSDWGELAKDGRSVTWSDDDVSVTLSTNDRLKIWNNDGGVDSIGRGIADDDSRGFKTPSESVRIDIEGADYNQAVVHLSGLGENFTENASHPTAIIIKAFDADGNVIGEQGGYKENDGGTTGDYVFVTEHPIDHFIVTSDAMSGDYVISGLTLSRTASAEVQLTTIYADGQEEINSTALNITHEHADESINLTEALIPQFEEVTEIPITTVEDGQLVLSSKDLLKNDFDLDGDPLSIIDVHATDDTFGEVMIDPQGQIVFTPRADFHGKSSFDYTVTDGHGSVDTATVFVTVNSENDLVIATADKVEAQEDTKTVFKARDLLRNDEDADGDKLYITDVHAGRDTHGEVSLNKDGDVVFIPEKNFFGEAIFEYTVSDGVGSTDTAKVTINVTPDNDPVIAKADKVEAQEDTKTVFTAKELLANDFDVDNEHLYITAVHVGPETHGDAYVNEFGDVVFIPEANYFGKAVFEYTVSDGAGSQDIAAVTIKVSEVNDPVIALDDWVETQEDTKTVFTAKELLANDADVDNDDLKIIDVHLGPDSHGKAYVNDSGDVVFIPEKNYFGEAVFEYTVSDGMGSSDKAAVNVHISEENDPVIAKDDKVEAKEDHITVFAAKELLGNDFDADNEYLHIIDVHVGPETHGDAYVNEFGDVVFIPEANYFGKAVFEYTVSDHAGSQDTAAVTIKVSEVNDPVIALDDWVETQEDTKTVFTAKELLGNDFDADNEGLQIIDVHLGPDSHGKAYVNDSGDVVFIPEKNYFGEAVFEYTVSDGMGSSDKAAVNVYITPDNDPVIAKDDKVEAKEDHITVFSAKELVGNDFDAENAYLQITDVHVGPETHGKAYVNEFGDVVFIPEKDFFGEAVFEYTVSDGMGSADKTSVTVLVTPENDPVIARDDYGLAPKEPMIRLDELPEYGVMQYLDGVEWKEMEVGVEYSAHTQVQFITNTEEVREITRDIRVGSFDRNDDNSTFSGTVSVNDWGKVFGDHAVFETDDGVKITTSVSNGVLTPWNGEGHVGSGIGNGTDNGLSNDEFLKVKVEAEAINQVTFSLDGLGSYFDKESSHATEVIITAYDAHGKVIDSQGGFRDSGKEFDQYQFTTDRPVDHFTLGTQGGDGTYVVQSMIVSRTATDEVKMTTIQGDGSELHNFVHLDLNHDTADTPLDLTEQLIEIDNTIDIAPFTVSEDSALTFTSKELLKNDFDLDGDVLSIVEVRATDETHGEVHMDEHGNILFTPAPDYHGPASFEYTVTDGNDSFDTATVFVEVTPVNDAPEIQGQVDDPQTGNNKTLFEPSINEDGQFILTDADILEHVTDIDGDLVKVTEVSYGHNDGELLMIEEGVYQFTPKPNWNGDVELDISVTDEGGLSDHGHVRFTVEAVADAPELEITDFDGNDLSNSTMIIDPDDTLELNIGAALVDQDLSETLTVTLDGVPKGSVINVDGDALLQNQANGLQSFEETQVTITFEGESAGYQNSVGVYKVDESGNIKDVEIIFDNASAQGSGGALIAGESSFTFNIGEGEHFNLFTVPNGAGTVSQLSQNDGQFVFRNDDGTPATMDSISPQLVFISDEKEVVVTGAAGDAVYHGGDSRNLNADNIVHTRTELNEDNEIIYGFEDLYGGGDEDFNDFIFSIDMGVVNNQLYAGEIMVDESESIQLPSTAINETIQISLPDDFSGEFDIRVEATARELSNDDTSTVSQTVHVDAREHAPESESKGATIDEDGDYIFTLDDFPFMDQNEADTLDSISIVALPLNGQVQLGDEPISDNQVISRADIEAGLLSYHSELNFNGEVHLTYTVSDGELHSQPQAFTINVEPVNDAPNAPALTIDGKEDQIVTIDPDFILQQVTDVEGDDITLKGLSVRHPENAILQQQPDGMFHLIMPPNFFGAVELGYQVSDGKEVVNGSLNVDIIQVNDKPFTEGNAHLTTHEDGAFTFNESDVLNLFGDIDTDNLVISRIITAKGEKGGKLVDNGDGNWTFSPAPNFAGTSDIHVIVTDGEFETSLNMPIYVRPVADGVVITTAHEGPLIFDEDSTGHLNLNMMMVDDSEILSHFTITGFPVGFEVSDGINTIIITEVGQVLNATKWDVGALELTPPDNFSGNFFLTVSATTVDYGDEASQPVSAQASIPSGDFEMEHDEPLLLTTAELLEMADSVDDNQEAHVHMVSFAKPNQGNIVDNGDGTWLVNAAKEITGELDIIYVVEQGGILHDAQSSIAVKGEDGIHQGVTVDAVVTTDVDEGNQLSFNDEDMLAQLSGDDLQIDSVFLSEGKGLLEEHEEGGYTFTPAEGFTGVAHIAFVASDGENSKESHFKVNVQSSSQEQALVMSDDGSIIFSMAQVVQELGLETADLVNELHYKGDFGTLIDNGDGDTHTFWPMTGFDGKLPIEAQLHNGEASKVEFAISLQEEGDGDLDTPLNVPDDNVDLNVPAEEVRLDEPFVPDFTAAPGGEVRMKVPEEILADQEDMDYVLISNLPEDANVLGGIEQDDGSVMMTGDLSQSVIVHFGDHFSGELGVHFQAYDGLDKPISDASHDVNIKVSEEYALGSGPIENVPDIDMITDQPQGWTQADARDKGVDVMDDSTGFENDPMERDSFQNDVDDNLT